MNLLGYIHVCVMSTSITVVAEVLNVGLSKQPRCSLVSFWTHVLQRGFAFLNIARHYYTNTTLVPSTFRAPALHLYLWLASRSIKRQRRLCLGSQLYLYLWLATHSMNTTG